ncbi:MAG: glycosyl transferase [Candidatus Competibacteraceae bacterium]|nr:glycosyl transferase [Candidatus Competibacteraceae bacterium]
MSTDLHSLSNGCYSLCLSPAGTGYSAWGELALTRWEADPTEDSDGFFLYLRDVESGKFWSLGQQPAGTAVAQRSYRFGAGRAELCCEHEDIAAEFEIVVPATADVELRRVTLRNRSDRPRRIELTSYAEVVLNTQAADAAHPAFSKLFIQTEFDAASGTLLARRRPRVPDESTGWLVHTLMGDPAIESLYYETDRARFIGRGCSLAAPKALTDAAPLSGTVGNVLDPIISLRQTVELAADGVAQLTFLLGAAPDREAALALVARFAKPAAVEAAFQAAEAGSGRFDPLTPDLFPMAGEGSSINPPSPLAGEGRGEGRTDLASGPVLDELLQFWNGYGGFNADGTEYVIRLQPDTGGRLRLPPRPWVNVVANPCFGFLASETGAGYTWSQNSRENRLTPWSNDPILDPPGEALYLRDEASGAFWSLQPGPIPQSVPYEVRHGFGYSHYRHISQDLEQQVWLFVPHADPVKIARIQLRNLSDQPRLLSLFAYARLVLGVLPADNAAALVIEQDLATGALLTENHNREFAGRMAFAAAAPFDRSSLHVSGDRATFIGLHGSLAHPAALSRDPVLNGRLGAGLDPCFALQLILQLEPGATAEYAFLIGEAENLEEARRLIDHYREDNAVAAALAEVREFWRNELGGVQIQTPKPALDVMVNGWLAYQTLSCRLWGRSAFYQSGGAFGFRDQLQDAAALLHHDPERTRQQILLHAAHQFQEGDVLHWWHPPTHCGIRTRFSDDLLWLPHVATLYARATGDWSLFSEPVRFLRARPLEPGEDEAFLTPEDSGEVASLYEHCCRALDRSLTQGVHGLPLMGSGDWNDGMNRVGREGRGESVWLGFFLYAILGEFIPVCGQHGDPNRARRYATFHRHLVEALNRDGWDGEWYRRAWYDHGAVLGSARSDECQIDALAQAWAVISKAAPWSRAESALDAVERHLIAEQDGLIRLLAPPFENTPHDPGYIKGYVAGVRENGGQYTHAALWVVRALAELGRRERAARLLEMLSPISRTLTPEAVAIYQLEPFMVAADVYGVAPHIGRGGWSGYTGAAGWMLRVALESILGLELVEGHTLLLRPCIPDDWPGFHLHYRLPDGDAVYDIEVRNPEGHAERVVAVEVDGVSGAVEDGMACIPLLRDGNTHRVIVMLAGRSDFG